MADYRGYGGSDGSPTFSAMMSDAIKVLEALRDLLTSRRYAGPVFVMGRSMGRHSAFELAANRSDDLAGLIIESGRPTLGQFVHGLDPAEAQTLEEQYQAMVRSIAMPVLVIHGEQDTLAPIRDAVSMYQDFSSPDKRLLTIPGSGHNDLMYVGINEYFTAINEFVSPPSTP